MAHFLQTHAVGIGFLAFFVLGWSYYMVATILMRGSIFEPMRQAIARREGFFWAKVREMLGCLMCTATETALWTVGLTAFVLGLQYGFVGQVLSAVFNKTVALHWTAETVLMLGISFALSLAISGEAWIIKTIFEHRERKFLALREEFRERELQLLIRIGELETKSAADSTQKFEFDLT